MELFIPEVSDSEAASTTNMILSDADYINMGTLVLDIETASPFEEPPDNSNDTQYFELFAVSLAYADDLNDTPETEVLFRRGDWDGQYTTDLYERLFEWCDDRSIDRLLTYNGAWFDGTHLLNWARDIDDSAGHNFLTRTEALFEDHVDVALAATDEYEAELWDDQHILPDWKVYDLAGIDNDSVWYDDYDFPDTYLSGIDAKAVQGKHIGASPRRRRRSYGRGIGDVGIAPRRVLVDCIAG